MLEHPCKRGNDPIRTEAAQELCVALASDTDDVEVKLEGQDPIALAPGLLAIPVAGHTRGSTALLADETFLFTGDHLWRSESRGVLTASREVCWYSKPAAAL